MENEETNGTFNAPAKWIRKSTRLTSVNFDAHLHDQAKQNNISLRDAMEFGINFLMGDRDGFDYPQSNLLNKFHKVVQHRNALLSEIDALRSQLKLKDQDVDDKESEEMDDLFNAEVENGK